MKNIVLLSLLSFILLLSQVNSRRILQQDFEHRHKKHQIEQGPLNVFNEDPFKQKELPEQKKKLLHTKGQERKWSNEELGGIYKPFPVDTEQEKEQQLSIEEQQYITDFNEFLGWGLFIGSIFLSFILIKTCIRKTGSRQFRNSRQLMHNQRMNVIRQPIHCQYIQNNTENIDEKIMMYQNQILKLKEVKQEMMRKQFDRKKMQEKKRIEMVNIQRQKQQQFPIRKNVPHSYGPNFYGAQQRAFIYTENNFHEPQPFVVKGVQPVKRERSNSFRTQVSQQPIIIKNDIRYRNGIPIGKPVRQQDNDSSFASQYPEV